MTTTTLNEQDTRELTKNNFKLYTKWVEEAKENYEEGIIDYKDYIKQLEWFFNLCFMPITKI